ncbi:MAG: glycosyltransferase family 2 protein [Gemmatimonadales bacterium]
MRGAAGGTVRIVNGCTLEGDRIATVGLPRSFLGASQVLEYLRAFLFGRMAWSELGALMIVSGAFGVFRKDVLVDVGGFRHDTIGEDMDLVVRIHRRLRSLRRPYRVVFVPDPVCWTECPETVSGLRNQRQRWQRGLGETLQHSQVMLANPRFGRIGLLALPYYMLCEYLAPIVEVAGYVILPFSWALGLLEPGLFLRFVGAAFAYGLCLSLATLLLEAVVPPLSAGQAPVAPGMGRGARELRAPAAAQLVAAGGADYLARTAPDLGQRAAAGVPERPVVFDLACLTLGGSHPEPTEGDMTRRMPPWLGSG